MESPVRKRGAPEKGFRQLAADKLVQDEMMLEVPISSKAMTEVVRKYCAVCDFPQCRKASYSDVIHKVMIRADKHNMSVRAQERLLEQIDEDKDGFVSPMETAVAQYSLVAGNQDYEPRSEHERLTFHGPCSKMKVCVYCAYSANPCPLLTFDAPQICIDEMFAKLQLRSFSFLRLCLERSGKPVVREIDTRLPPFEEDELAGGQNGQNGRGAQAHLAESNKEDAKDLSQLHSSPKRERTLDIWLENDFHRANSAEALMPRTSREEENKVDCLLVERRHHASNSPQRGVTRGVKFSSPTPSDAFSNATSIRKKLEASAHQSSVEHLESIIVASSPRRRSLSPQLSPLSTRLLDDLKTCKRGVTLDRLIQSVEPAPKLNRDMMTSTEFTRGTAKIWGGNWGLRDANLTLQHDAFRVLESPTCGTGRSRQTLRSKKLLQPLPEIQRRGQAAIEQELHHIFNAYARPTDLFPDAHVYFEEQKCVILFRPLHFYVRDGYG